MRIRIKSFHIRHNKIGQKNTNKTEFRWPRRGVEIANYRTAPEHVGYLPEQYHGRRFACVYPGQTQAQTLCQLSENIPRIVDTGTIQVLINIFLNSLFPGSRTPFLRFLLCLYFQYLAGCRDSNPRCFDRSQAYYQ